MIDKNDPRLTAFLLGELDVQEASVISAALRESPDLQEHVDELRATIEQLNQAFHPQNDRPSLTDAQLRQLDTATCHLDTSTAAVPTMGVSRHSNSDAQDRLINRLGWRNLALAALALYAVGISWFALRSPRLATADKANSAIVSATSQKPLDVVRSQDGTTSIAVADPRSEVRQNMDLDADAGMGIEMTSPAPAAEPPMPFNDAGGQQAGVGGRLSQVNDQASPLPTNESDINRFASRGSSDVLPNGVELEELGVGETDAFSLNTGFSRQSWTESNLNDRDLGLQSEYAQTWNYAPLIEGTTAAPELSSSPIHLPNLAQVVASGEVHVQLAEAPTIVAAMPESNTLGRSSVDANAYQPLNAPAVLDVKRDVLSELDVIEQSDSMNKVDDLASLAAVKERAKDDTVAQSKATSDRTARTWRPATASTNRARLSVGHHDDLTLVARDTYVRIDGFRARVFFDCYYYNDRGQQLEGQFMLRLPNDASLHYFAFGATTLPASSELAGTDKAGEVAAHVSNAADLAVQTLRQQMMNNGSDLARRAADANFTSEPNSTFGLVKAARIAPRQKAAIAYDETVRRRIDPCAVEWAGPGIFQTRVFPLLPNQLHRIVIGYDVTLQDDGDDRVYLLPLPTGDAGGRVEFDIAAAAGTEVTISPQTDAFVSGGRAYYRFEHAEARDYVVRLAGTNSVMLNSGNGSDAYFATRILANLPESPAATDTHQAVFLLDTSWSDRPAAFSKRLKLLEQVLEQNRETIHEFAVLLFNVEQRWWRPAFAPNAATNVTALMNDANQLALEGATDLQAALSEATSPAWMSRHNESVPQPNFFLFSDAAATWGKTDLASLADPLTKLTRSAGGGALFTYHLAGHSSDRLTMEWLAESSGGAVFNVTEETDLARVAIAHRSRPWEIVGWSAEGANDLLVQGISKLVYPKQALVIAGRGSIKGPLRIDFQRGTEKQTLEFVPKVSIASPAAARLFGQLAVERLEPYAEDFEVGLTIAFARYFRVPGRTCSLVMLDSQQDYQNFEMNVPAEDDKLVIVSTSIVDTIAEQESEALEQRQQPRKRFLNWVDSLTATGVLRVSTALGMAMKRLPETAFQFNAKRLECRGWKTDHLGTDFKAELERDELGFDVVMDEAERRLIAFGADDALKAASTLVDAKPADVDTLRSVAFRAIQWQRSDQAAPLLWRLTQSRPYQPQGLLLLARAVWESGDTDAAIICYDLVSTGNWNERWSGAKKVAELELLQLLEKVDSGQMNSDIPHYARARLQQLREQWCNQGMDLAVVMHWNTDRTDVDLHLTEPSGEECFYSHSRTSTGGQLTQDITAGLGPEMYFLEQAPVGSYRVEAKYFASDANRTKARTEGLVTIVRNAGRPNSQSQTNRITLEGTGDKRPIVQLNVNPTN